MIDIIVMKGNHNISQDIDTETKILRAAEQEFAAKGYAGARTTSIAEAAGVTHAMFHYYFRTKEKLFDRIISEKVTLLKKALLNSIVNPNAPLSEILRDVIENHLNFMAANPDLPRFLVGEIYSNPERSKAFLGALSQFAPTFIKFLQDKIDEEVAEGKCRKIDAKMLMLDLVSLNIFSYMAFPVVKATLGDCMDDAEKFLELRKKNNYDTIMSKLRP